MLIIWLELCSSTRFKVWNKSKGQKWGTGKRQDCRIDSMG